MVRVMRVMAVAAMAVSCMFAARPAHALDEKRLVDDFITAFAPRADSASSPRAFRGIEASSLAPDATLVMLEVLRSWDELSEQAKSELSKYLTLSEPRNGTRTVQSVSSNGCSEVVNEQTGIVDETEHFRFIHIATGPHAATDAYMVQLKALLEDVYRIEVSGFNLPPPPPAFGSKHTVYVCNLIGETGYITGRTKFISVDTANNYATAVMEFDNDYAELTGYISYPIMEYAKDVVSHEFFHTVQIGMNYSSPSLMFLESTAVAMEKLVRPESLDYLSFAEPFFDSPETSLDNYISSSMYAYSNAIFFVYLNENLKEDFIIDAWLEFDKRCNDLTIPWCKRAISEFPLVKELIEKNGSTLEEQFFGYSVANLTKNYYDGAEPEFPAISKKTLSVPNNSSVSSNIDLRHLSSSIWKVSDTAANRRDYTLEFTAPATTVAASVIEYCKDGIRTETLTRPLTGKKITVPMGAGGDCTGMDIIVVNVSLNMDSQMGTLKTTAKTMVPKSLAVAYEAGWNMVGIPFEPGVKSLQQMTGLTDRTFYQLLQNRMDFEPAQLQPAVPGNAYWVYFPANATVNMDAFTSNTNSVALKKGWNLVSNPTIVPKAWHQNMRVGATVNSTVTIIINDALSFIDTNLLVYNPATGTYEKKATSTQFFLHPGRGFLIRALKDCYLVFQ